MVLLLNRCLNAMGGGGGGRGAPLASILENIQLVICSRVTMQKHKMCRFHNFY